MADAYIKVRARPDDSTTSWTEVQITSSDEALNVTGVWRPNGKIFVVLEESSNIVVYSSNNFGKDWTLMSTLVAGASCPFSAQDHKSGQIGFVYWQSNRLYWNFSNNEFSSINSTSRQIYSTDVDEQQASFVYMPNGVIVVSFKDENAAIVSYKSSDNGFSWSAC